MAEMSRLESALCRSAPWRLLASRALLPWALQGARLRGDVLEVGSGSGAMAAAILRRFPTARLTATDFDPQMVGELERRLRPFGARATVRREDATALSFSDASFDAVLSFVMLHHVVAWERALAELVRVLRPGGLLVGWDMLHTRVFDRLERTFGRGDERLIPLSELGPRLATLPLADVALRPVAGGIAVRFRAARTA